MLSYTKLMLILSLAYITDEHPIRSLPDGVDRHVRLDYYHYFILFDSSGYTPVNPFVDNVVLHIMILASL
jgi:hypothetical protein